MNATTQGGELSKVMDAMGARARQAARELAGASTEQKNAALLAAAECLENRLADILAANQNDLQAARASGLSEAMLDRLMLDESRVLSMADGLRNIAELDDPVGRVLAQWTRPNGLHIQRLSVPLGVIGIIYESRPNVTADAGALCLKAGNAVILRGGSESFHSSGEIHACLCAGLEAAGLPADSIQMVPTTDREAVGYLLSEMAQYLDVLIPRGGKGLVARVEREARVPVLGHLEGICHLYVDASADLELAVNVVVNAKMRRTGICGAAETLLLDRQADPELVAALIKGLSGAGCEVRADQALRERFPELPPAEESDWSTEYLAPVISAAMVDGVESAIAHIQRYGTGHTESVIAGDIQVAERFLSAVDSAIVMHNTSTQFADGGEFGMGAEVGIATGRLHARGPVGVEQLTSYKYVVRGSGQLRP
ncbi:MAG: glutamate-5-semialdehyde dehydrogenase [Chromatiales bacterium]|nr:glutamate-5-semialdehyde dehydrogenase [Chromatiales bacterium]